MAEERAEDRARSALTRLFAAVLLVLAALGAPFVFSYRSEGAVIGPFSPRYLFGVALPFAMACGLLLLFLLAKSRVVPWMGASLGRLPRLPAALAALAGAAAAVVYSFLISDERVSVLMCLLLPCAIALAWAAAFGRLNPVLACLPVVAGGCLLFAAELAESPFGSSLAVWGDDSTFAALFPREPPFIGPGGRLRPNLDVRMRAPEYRRGARLVTNAVGFRNETEFAPRPAAGLTRVLSLGDSFSTGFGADQEQFFGAILERLLNGSHVLGRAEVMNAEVSDPAYGLHYLQGHGMGYRPTLVIYGLSGNDIMQAEQFLGEDRLFRLDYGQIEANPGFDPSVESAWSRLREHAYPVAAEPGGISFGVAPAILSKLIRFRLFSSLASLAEREASRPADTPSYAQEYERADGRKRLIDGAANLGFYYRDEGQTLEPFYRAFFQLLVAMHRTTRDGGASFLLVIHPSRVQTQPRDWEEMRRRWRLDEADFDPRMPNRRIAAFCEEHGIRCCDLLDAFTEASRELSLYLPGGDTHYNRHGHEVAARATVECIVRGWEAHAPD